MKLIQLQKCGHRHAIDRVTAKRSRNNCLIITFPSSVIDQVKLNAADTLDIFYEDTNAHRLHFRKHDDSSKISGYKIVKEGFRYRIAVVLPITDFLTTKTQEVKHEIQNDTIIVEIF